MSDEITVDKLAALGFFHDRSILGLRYKDGYYYIEMVPFAEEMDAQPQWDMEGRGPKCRITHGTPATMEEFLLMAKAMGIEFKEGAK